MPGDTDKIDILVSLENSVSGPATEATLSIDELGRIARETAAELGLTDEAIKRQRKALEDLAIAARAASSEENRLARSEEGVAAAATEQAAATGKASRALKSHSGVLDNVEKKVNKVTTSSNKLDKILTKINKFAWSKLLLLGKLMAQLQLIELLAAGIASLGAAGFAAVAGMAPLAGTLILFPALLGAGAQALGTMKLATAGFGNALKQLNMAVPDAKAINLALSKLSPNARTAALSVQALNKQFYRTTKYAVQENFFAGINAGLHNAQSLLPVVSVGLQKTATAMGNLAHHALDVAGSPVFTSELANVMDTNVKTIGFFGNGLISLGQVLLRLLVIGKPFILWIGTEFQKGTEYLNAFVHSADGTNKLAAFFESTKHVLTETIKILANFTVGFVDLGHAAGVTSTYMGSGLLTLSKHFRDFTSSATGQNKIQGYFMSILPVLHQFSILISGLFHIFGGLAATGNGGLETFLILINTKLIPAIAAFISGGNGTKIANELVNIATSLVKLAGAVQGNAASGVLFFLQIIGAVAKVFADLPSGVQGVILALVGVSGIFATIGLGIYRIGLGIKTIKELAVAIGELKAVEWLAAKATAAWEAVQVVLDAELWANPIGLIILAVIALVAIIAIVTFEIIKHWKAVSAFFVMLWNGLVFGFKATINWITNAWSVSWSTVVNIVSIAWQSITGFISGLWSDITKAFDSGLGAISGAWNTVWDGFQSAVKSAWDVIATIINGGLTVLLEPIQLLIDGINEIIKGINAIPNINVGGVHVGIPNIPTIPNLNIPQVPGATPDAKTQGGPLAPGNSTKPAGKWSGGNVFPGQDYVVGEKGMEFFRDMAGKISSIGASGPQMMRFDLPGVVIPHHEIGTAATTSDPTRHAPMLSGVGSSQTRTLEKALTIEGDNIDITIISNGEGDIERKLNEVLAKHEARKRNRINWMGVK